MDEFEALIKALEKQGIQTVLRMNTEEIIYGIAALITAQSQSLTEAL